MTRAPQSKRPSARKAPAKTSRRGTAPARKASKKAARRTRAAKSIPGAKASKKKGKSRTASARKHGGASKAATKSSGEGGAETPGAIGGRVVVQNVNVPGYTTTLDATKYHAMRDALLKVLPAEGAGLTQAEMMAAVKPHLPQTLFPGRAKSEWWTKGVQLDLEAKDVIRRDGGKPLRWRKS